LSSVFFQLLFLFVIGWKATAHRLLGIAFLVASLL